MPPSHETSSYTPHPTAVSAATGADTDEAHVPPLSEGVLLTEAELNNLVLSVERCSLLSTGRFFALELLAEVSLERRLRRHCRQIENGPSGPGRTGLSHALTASDLASCCARWWLILNAAATASWV